ncbi:hypothetical protein BDV12DRAFT_205698 [Aspergillus spectabilis]
MLAAFILALAATLPLIEALPSNAESKHRSDWDSTRHVIAFGDSYTFVQGIHGYPNYSFIGDQLNFEFDARILLSNKIVQNQTGTSTGGPNWVEYLTGCGLKQGLTSPLSCYRQLWNFAFAGAGVSAEHIPLHHPFTTSLVNQITQYKTYAHPVLTSTSRHERPLLNTDETLVALWIGINDINDSADYADKTFYDTLLTTLFSSLETLQELGFRDYLILNLPPLYRTPANQAREPEDQSPHATQVGWFNSALAEHSRGFERQNPGSNVLLFDAHFVLNGILDSPERYGILNTTDICPGAKQPDIETEYEKYGCPTPVDTYFWYDAGHIGRRVHGVLAGALDHVLGGR